jgi:hypothetical protein
MCCYISSSGNRFYAPLESTYGVAAAATESVRLPAIKLAVNQDTDAPRRRDKTGGRTFAGLPPGFRKKTTFDLETYLTGWTDNSSEPCYGPLFQGALGSAPIFFAGADLQTMANPVQMVFATPHGLISGQAVVHEGEMRFVNAVIDDATVAINAPFTTQPADGATIGPTVTYVPNTCVPSVSIYDYWDPQTAVQRILAGCGVNEMRVRLNGDFHHFRFKGSARELVDSVTFEDGQAGLNTFPAEPDLANWNYSLVPGNMGQAWLGLGPSQFFSVLSAEVVLNNNLDTRNREFGSALAMCINPGKRSVSLNLSIFGDDEAQTIELYQAAQQRSPVPVMLQLGQTAGNLCGIHMKSVVPGMPQFDDSETRLQWHFEGSQAQGTINDEITVAFG